MIVLTIIGLVVVLIAALYLSFDAVVSFIASIAMTGKVSADVYFLLALSVVTWCMIFGLWPF